MITIQSPIFLISLGQIPRQTDRLTDIDENIMAPPVHESQILQATIH